MRMVMNHGQNEQLVNGARGPRGITEYMTRV